MLIVQIPGYPKSTLHCFNIATTTHGFIMHIIHCDTTYISVKLKTKRHIFVRNFINETPLKISVQIAKVLINLHGKWFPGSIVYNLAILSFVECRTIKFISTITHFKESVVNILSGW